MGADIVFREHGAGRGCVSVRAGVDYAADGHQGRLAQGRLGGRTRASAAVAPRLGGARRDVAVAAQGGRGVGRREFL